MPYGMYILPHTHTHHYFSRSVSVLIINMYNPFMHCVTSQYSNGIASYWCCVLSQSQQHNNSSTRHTVTSLQQLLNDMFHQHSSTQWSKLRIWKIYSNIYIYISNSPDKAYLIPCIHDRSVIRVRTDVCVRKMMVKLTWLVLLVCTTSSLVVQSSSTVSCAFQCPFAHTCTLLL